MIKCCKEITGAFTNYSQMFRFSSSVIRSVRCLYQTRPRNSYFSTVLLFFLIFNPVIQSLKGPVWFGLTASIFFLDGRNNKSCLRCVLLCSSNMKGIFSSVIFADCRFVRTFDKLRSQITQISCVPQQSAAHFELVVLRNELWTALNFFPAYHLTQYYHTGNKQIFTVL